MSNTDIQCDMDTWTKTGKAVNWLVEQGATRLATAYGFHFYENPITGDESPILAVEAAMKPAGTVWNTQDFDLPTFDPRSIW